MKRSTRRSLLASAVFILAGIGGAVGGHVTDALTPAVVTFSAILLLGALAALVLDHLNEAKETDEVPGDRTTPQAVDARGAAAVQVGNHNLQVNYPGPRESVDQKEQ